MKVLRTALFGAFLMVCFAHIGYAQQISFTPQMTGMSMATLDDRKMEVSYDLLTPANSYTEIIVWKESSLVSGTPGRFRTTLYTETFNSSAVVNTSISTIINVPSAFGNRFIVECVACEGDDCSRVACIVTIEE